MKSAEHRDIVVALVKQTFDKYRTFGSLPLYGGDEKAIVGSIVVADPQDERAYVVALHEFFNKGPKVTLAGRDGNRLVAVKPTTI